MQQETDDAGNWADALWALSQRITDAQERLRARVSARIDEIIQVTEQSALASADAVGIVNARAREQCDLFKRVVDTFDAEHRRSVELVERQRELGAAAVECLHRQMECVDSSVQITAQIDDLAGTIGKIALGARILTLNGQCEAARLGEAGRPFGVIVDQLRELSARVESANQTIARLAKELEAAMPTIAQGSHELLGITEQIMEVKSQGTLSQGTMAALLRESQATSEDISVRTLQVLEHLQAQDWLTQRLRAMEPLNERFGRALEALFTRLGEAGITEPEDVLRVLEATVPRQAAPAARAEVLMEPGQIVMF